MKELPEWFDEPDISKWPSEARAAYGIMAAVAQRRLERQTAQTQTPAPAA